MQLAAFPEPRLIDPGAERNVLACALKTSDAWVRVQLTADDFVTPINRALWIVVDHLYTKGAATDPIVVQESLPREHQLELEGLGGWNYIQALRDLPIDPQNIVSQASKLLDLSVRRRIADAGRKITALATASNSLDDIRSNVEIAVGEIDAHNVEDATPIGLHGTEFINAKLAHPTETPGLSSGFAMVDQLTQGFQPGRLYVVGARKKIGKSMLLLNWAKYIAVDAGIPILWISTEHTIDDEYSRLLALTSNVREMLINNGEFSTVDAYVDRVADARERIARSPFYFVSMPFFSLDKLRRLARLMVRVHGVKALFFDYIKSPQIQADTQEWQELGVFTYGLKALGISESIPVISAVQINRDGQKSFRFDGEIDSDYFAGSDRIAQALSVAWVLRQPTDREASDQEQFRVLRCTDNRHGPSSLKLLLDFAGSVASLRENRRL